MCDESGRPELRPSCVLRRLHLANKVRLTASHNLAIQRNECLYIAEKLRKTASFSAKLVASIAGGTYSVILFLVLHGMLMR